MSAEYVVEGATLECSLGVASSKLLVAPPHGVELRGKNRANIGDGKPFVNIFPFSACKITSPPKPCTPACVMWVGGKADGSIKTKRSNNLLRLGEQKCQLKQQVRWKYILIIFMKN